MKMKIILKKEFYLNLVYLMLDFQKSLMHRTNQAISLLSQNQIKNLKLWEWTQYLQGTGEGAGAGCRCRPMVEATKLGNARLADPTNTSSPDAKLIFTGVVKEGS